jgi:hypothetical protein
VILDSLEFTREQLVELGFTGWSPARDIVRDDVPRGVQGVYLAMRDRRTSPSFLRTSSAGQHKRRDPTLPISELEKAWLPSTGIVYIGKAHLTSHSDLQRRVWSFVRHGRGRNAGHWGGRATWQLADGPELLIAWWVTERDARAVEKELLAAFVAKFGRLPYANLVS